MRFCGLTTPTRTIVHSFLIADSDLHAAFEITRFAQRRNKDKGRKTPWQFLTESSESRTLAEGNTEDVAAGQWYIFCQEDRGLDALAQGALFDMRGTCMPRQIWCHNDLQRHTAVKPTPSRCSFSVSVKKKVEPPAPTTDLLPHFASGQRSFPFLPQEHRNFTLRQPKESTRLIARLGPLAVRGQLHRYRYRSTASITLCLSRSFGIFVSLCRRLCASARRLTLAAAIVSSFQCGTDLAEANGRRWKPKLQWMPVIVRKCLSGKASCSSHCFPRRGSSSSVCVRFRSPEL